jgi:hypothetical protein
MNCVVMIPLKFRSWKFGPRSWRFKSVKMFSTRKDPPDGRFNGGKPVPSSTVRNSGWAVAKR